MKREASKPSGATILVPTLAGAERLDKFLIRQFPHTGRNYWREHWAVQVNGKKAAKGNLLSGGETIRLPTAPPENSFPLLPNPKLELKLLYVDDFLIACDKPAGLPCHPLKSGERSTLVNAVVARFPEQAKIMPAREAGLIHRLDNETSGIVLFARSAETLATMRAMSQGGKILKTYLGLVQGRVLKKGRIDWPIGHHPTHSKKMRIDQQRGRPACTEYDVLESGEQASLLRLKIRVGARHQIRVHLAALGHPILGDRLYGTKAGYQRHFLHAWKLEFVHPWRKKRLSLSAPPPEEFERLRAALLTS